MSITIPKDFAAVVLTPTARVGHDVVAALLSSAEDEGLPRFKGHRILHMQNVEQVDSAAIAGLMRMAEIARSHNMELIACDPPPVVRSYLEIYGATAILEGNVLTAHEDGSYRSDRWPFIPPFVPHTSPRLDVYSNGRVRSFELGRHGLREIAPVDLSRRVIKAKGRTRRMVVPTGDGAAQELKAGGYVLLRRYCCGSEATHTTFARLHEIHSWYRRKGFDFQRLELWASELPAGLITERMVFRDRLHMDHFQALLKVDQGWKALEQPEAESSEELHNQFE